MFAKPLIDQMVPALAERFRSYSQRNGRKPKLTVVLIGNDPASETYVQHKQNFAARIDVDSELVRLPKDASAAQIEDAIATLSRSHKVDGILLQQPLPKGIDPFQFEGVFDPKKDVDGFHSSNLGKLLLAKPTVQSCTPDGIITLLKFYGISLAGKNVLVAGRSPIVGRPVQQLLLNEDATVTQIHSKSKISAALLESADISVIAIGKPHFFKATQFKKNSVIVDVGIHRDSNGKIIGDVDMSGADEYLSAYTPVPGGVGPMTILSLFKNLALLIGA